MQIEQLKDVETLEEMRAEISRLRRHDPMVCRVMEATCAVGGMIRPGAMCGSVIVGGKLCGHNGPCEHRRVVTPNVAVERAAKQKVADSGPLERLS